MIIDKIFVISVYLFCSFLFGGLIGTFFEAVIQIIWDKSGKTKCNWLVKKLYLNEEKFRLLGYDKRYPKWYKSIQILVGLLWPISVSIICFIGGVYILIIKLPIFIYDEVLKPIFIWWTGDSKKQ